MHKIIFRIYIEALLDGEYTHEYLMSIAASERKVAFKVPHGYKEKYINVAKATILEAKSYR
jgi:hypothetical protein